MNAEAQQAYQKNLLEKQKTFGAKQYGNITNILKRVHNGTHRANRRILTRNIGRLKTLHRHLNKGLAEGKSKAVLSKRIEYIEGLHSRLDPAAGPLPRPRSMARENAAAAPAHVPTELSGIEESNNENSNTNTSGEVAPVEGIPPPPPVEEVKPELDLPVVGQPGVFANSNNDALQRAVNEYEAEELASTSSVPAAVNNNIMREMIEGENAVQAVNDYERGTVAATKAEDTTKETIPEPPIPGNESEPTLDCSQLFDPCSREPLSENTIQSLETRVKEIKASLMKIKPHDERESLPSDVLTRLDLLIYMLKRDKSPDRTLLDFKQSEQIYEAYWDIVFAIGTLMEEFPRTDGYFMANKKAELIRGIDESPEFMSNPIEYLEARGVNMGASGASDITFGYKTKTTSVETDPCLTPPKNKQDKQTIYFCSSKLYKDDKKKDVSKFDIQNIFMAAKNIDRETVNVKIVLLVRNNTMVEEKVRNAARKYMAEEALYIYGEQHLYSALSKLYDSIRAKASIDSINKISLGNILGVESRIRPPLVPRLHQHIAIHTIADGIKQFKSIGGLNNRFLVGILPRGGKTYIAGGIVSTLQPKRVVVILGAKSETISQFTDELFSWYQDFSDYEVFDVVESTPDFRIDPAKKYVFVMSTELYKKENSTRQLLKDLKGGEHRADLFICDEAHLKQATWKAEGAMKAGEQYQEEVAPNDEQEDSEVKADEIGKTIDRKIPVVYMTGTYIKPLTAFKIPKENTVIWEYEDIQKAKNLSKNEEYFKQNFGKYYTNALEKLFSYGETYESLEATYQRFPDLYLLSTNFTPEAKEAFSKQLDDGSKGGAMTLTQLFQVKPEFDPAKTEPSLWYEGFRNPNGMARLVNYLSPTNEIKAADESIAPINSVMKRIDRIAQRINDRLAFFTSDFRIHSQLWFLPSMQGHPLLKRFCALAGTVFLSTWYRKHFDILCVSSSVNWKSLPRSVGNSIEIPGDDVNGVFKWAIPEENETLKECIVRHEKISREKGKGLVIIAQNMLHLGISLSCVDIVVLLDTGEKVDERIQKMYRALTESVNKKGGFIVDMNYFRTVTAIMNYQIQSSRLRGKEVDSEDIPRVFRSTIESFSIDDDIDIYGGIDEGGPTTIESETIPELKKMLTLGGKRAGNSIGLIEVGAALNRNIESVVQEDFRLEDFLGEVANNDKVKKLLRGTEGNVPEAGENREGGPPKAGVKPDIFPEEAAKTDEGKKRAFIDIFKTTLKLGIFGTDASTLEELRVKLEDDAFYEVLVDTLIKRGAVKEDVDRGDLKAIILLEMDKILAKGKGATYIRMREKVTEKEAKTGKFQEVLEYINQHLTPKDKERHKYGEVFTPLTLVDEMLSKLPKEVWTKKDWKWLDPANGIGNFPIKAFVGQDEGEFTYPGLFKGLESAIPNPDARCKHIIENMLYMVDINGKNNMVARRLFEKLCPGAKANIEQIDKKNGFLAEKPLVFNGKEVSEFHVIMGNPPFQGGAVRGKTTEKTRKIRENLDVGQDKHKNLWIPFVKKILTTTLKKDGYLLFIHPIGWFKPDRTGIHEDILKYQIHYIKIFFIEESKRIFSGSGEINTSYYLLEKTNISLPTKIVDIYKKIENIKLTPNSIISLAYNGIFSKVQNKSKLFYQGDDHKGISVNKTNCSSGSNKLIHRFDEKGQITYVKAAVEHKEQHIPKIILSGYKSPRFYYDKGGEYGLIGSHQHYFTGDKLDRIDKYFKTKLSALLLANIKYDQKFIDPRYYPDVRELPLDRINDETLADYFGFTKEERAAIAATEYPKREYKFKEITCAQLKGEKEQEGGGEDSTPIRNTTRKIRRSDQ